MTSSLQQPSERGTVTISLIYRSGNRRGDGKKVAQGHMVSDGRAGIRTQARWRWGRALELPHSSATGQPPVCCLGQAPGKQTGPQGPRGAHGRGGRGELWGQQTKCSDQGPPERDLAALPPNRAPARSPLCLDPSPGLPEHPKANVLRPLGILVWIHPAAEGRDIFL